MKVTYQFASVWKRLGAGICDYLSVSLVSIGMMFLFLIGTNIYEVFHNNAPVAGWRFFSFSIINFCWYFLYFILIPYWCQGYTLWTKVIHFKMIDNQDLKLEIKQLCAHNSLLWMSMMGWMVVIGCCYWIFDSLNQAQNFLLGMLTFNTSSPAAHTIGFGIGVFMRIITVIIGLITGGMLINIALNRSTYSFVDSMSDTYMVNDQPDVETNPNNCPNTLLKNDAQQMMPGMILDQDDIDLTDSPSNKKNKESHDEWKA